MVPYRHLRFCGVYHEHSTIVSKFIANSVLFRKGEISFPQKYTTIYLKEESERTKAFSLKNEIKGIGKENKERNKNSPFPLFKMERIKLKRMIL